MMNEAHLTPTTESIAIADRGKRPLLGLNIIRAAAIVLVVINHTIQTQSGSAGEHWLHALTAPDAVLFLILSGALLLPLSVSTGTFLRQRATRVLTPFIAWSIIYAALTYFLITGSKFWFAEQVRWLLLNPTFNEGWFIPVILGLYLAYPILTPWIKTASRKQLRYFLILWFGALTLPYLQLIMGVKTFEGTIVGPFFGYVGYAVAGYYLMRYPRLSATRVAIAAACILGGVAAPMATYYAGFNSPFADLIGDNLTLPTALLSTALFALISPITRPRRCGKAMGAAIRAVDFVAAYAFLIYLIHPLFVRYLIPNYLPELQQSWLYCPAVVAASLLLGTVIKRLPGIRHILS